MTVNYSNKINNIKLADGDFLNIIKNLFNKKDNKKADNFSKKFLDFIDKNIVKPTSLSKEYRFIPNDRISILSIAGVSSLLTALSIKLINNKIEKILLRTPTATENQLESLKNVSGLPKIPIFETPIPIENAFYRPKPIILDTEDIKEELKQYSISPSRSELINAKKHGYIVYDKNFKTIGILGHELGHANIGNRPWYSLGRLNQSLLRPISYKLYPLASLASFIVGVKTKSPVAGALTGLAASSLLGLPMLMNEWQATRIGNKLMQDVRMREITRRKNKQLLKEAFKTYFYSVTMPSTLIGTLGAFIK